MNLKWPTYEEFEEACTQTRALSDARGDLEVQEDAWQTNVMVRITSDDGQNLDLEPMLLDEDYLDSPRKKFDLLQGDLKDS